MATQLSMFAPVPENTIKRAVLQHHQDNPANREWLEKARSAARRYCYQNYGLVKYGTPGTVTSDDIRDMMMIYKKERWAKDGTVNNRMGAVFMDGRFEKVGYYKSRAVGSHANVIVIWKLKSTSLNI